MLHIHIHGVSFQKIFLPFFRSKIQICNYITVAKMNLGVQQDCLTGWSEWTFYPKVDFLDLTPLYPSHIVKGCSFGLFGESSQVTKPGCFCLLLLCFCFVFREKYETAKINHANSYPSAIGWNRKLNKMGLHLVLEIQILFTSNCKAKNKQTVVMLHCVNIHSRWNHHHSFCL